jgi:pimeloyl-ACP methyl ester carboxylesterase
MNGADLSPPGLAAMIAEFIEQLQLREVTVVGNDTGGALCQILCANHPELIERLVLTNCDAFEHFPPIAFRAIEAAGVGPASVSAGWLSPGRRRIVLAGRQQCGFTPHCPNLQELWFDLTRSR